MVCTRIERIALAVLSLPASRRNRPSDWHSSSVKPLAISEAYTKTVSSTIPMDQVYMEGKIGAETCQKVLVSTIRC